MPPVPPADASTRRSFARLLGLGAAGALLAPASSRAQTPLAATPAPSPQSPDAVAPILLDSNENPYGPPRSALDAVAAALPSAARYPDRVVDELVEALARHHGVSTDSIALGAGSSQILHAAANAWCGPDAPAVAADPTFEALPRYAGFRGAPVTRVPLTADFHHDLERMAAACGQRALCYVCNPNNPTASVTPAGALQALLERLPPSVVVLVDEAYHEYAAGAPGYESLVPALARHPNLVVARTFSKIYGLAGLRCGYAVARPERIAELRRQLPWDVSNLAALVAARAALADTAFVADARTRNAELREATARALAALGARVVPSAANFLFADVGTDVEAVKQALADRGIRVGRRFAALPNHLRVTVGTASEMRAFLTAFEAVRTVARAA